MDNTSTIFWFSGTGNSLYAAKRLSAELDDTQLIQITDAVPTAAVGGKGAKVGFVFPSYYWNLPRAVRKFVERLEIKPDTYVFTIVTMGGIGHGSISALNKVLKAKGLRLHYGKGVKMPDNYILLYNPTDPNTCEAMLDKNNKQLCEIAAEINSETQSVKGIPVSFNSLYKNIERLDDKFTVNDSCTNCRLCKKICPVGNIAIENNKPKWLHRCEHCVACISWCSAKAINYGNKTQARNRYCNPRVKTDELTRDDV
jgi:Pyruvate/2-oxoacid:ferredoxin oxidoreductase delta subunit